MKILPLFLLSLLGILNAFYLHWQYLREKKLGRKMICLMGSDCFNVIDSKYGITFGIKNETYGFIYYFILLAFSVLGLISDATIKILSPFLFIVTLIAALFSIYLTIIQAIILKKYCFWCLIANCLNILIFGYNIYLIQS